MKNLTKNVIKQKNKLKKKYNNLSSRDKKRKGIK
jgi:hypothetical protein